MDSSGKFSGSELRFAPLTINCPGCTSCSPCWSTCHDVFGEEPDNGLSRIAEKYRKDGDKATGKIPEEHSACAQEAAERSGYVFIHGVRTAFFGRYSCGFAILVNSTARTPARALPSQISVVSRHQEILR